MPDYVSQIAFAKTTSASSSGLASVFDYLLWYAKNSDAVKMRAPFQERAPIENPNERYVCVETPDGQIIDLSRAQKEGKEPIPAGADSSARQPNRKTRRNTSAI